MPDWANWRDEAYGFTLEPAVIVYATQGLEPGRGAAFAAGTAPAAAGRARPLPPPCRHLRHRRERAWAILFATQDSLLSNQFWRLTIALGEATARLFATSGEILDAIERGEVLIGYNVLGSYALARQQAGAPIGIVLPRDYTLWMSRVVVIPARRGRAGDRQAVRRLPALAARPGRGRGDTRDARPGPGRRRGRRSHRTPPRAPSRSPLGRRCWSSSTG